MTPKKHVMGGYCSGYKDESHITATLITTVSIAGKTLYLCERCYKRYSDEVDKQRRETFKDLFGE